MKTPLFGFYATKYPCDPCGRDIDRNSTFEDLYGALKGRTDVYKVIGTGDSVIRRGLFDKLAEILRVDYSTVYDL